MSIFKLTKMEETRLNQIRKDYPLPEDWYKINAKLQLIQVPYYLLNVCPQSFLRDQQYSHYIDPDFANLLASASTIVLSGVESGRLKIQPQQRYFHFGEPHGIWENDCAIVDILYWIEFEQQLDIDFPLKFSDEATKYIKNRNNIIETIGDMLANYKRVKQEHDKLLESDKARAKPTQEKMLCFLICHYSKTKSLPQDAIAKNLLADMQTFFSEEECPTERSIYRTIKVAQFHNPKNS